MLHKNTLLAVLTLSAVALFGAQASNARPNDTGINKRPAATAKITGAERGKALRHDSGRRDGNRNYRNDNSRRDGNRNHRNDNRRHEARKPDYRHDNRDHRRDNYRHDRHYSRPAPGYWRDYHYGRAHGYHHRYHSGHHYYYNHAGFYFPGFGFIAHGHVHHRHCPHWHFEPFAAGLILGTIFGH